MIKALVSFVGIMMFAVTVSVAQEGSELSSKVEKLVGMWRYKLGSGYESWEKDGNNLVGAAFRINKKTNDTSKVEDISIRAVDKSLIFTMQTYNYGSDSVKVISHNFVGTKRKMKFTNTGAGIPYAIQYSFGFMNRNKLIISVYYGVEEKPVKLILYRVKDKTIDVVE